MFPSALIPEDVRHIGTRLAEKGFRAWLVGGCVRDAILQKPVADWDLATDAKPEDVVRTFRSVIPTGIAHGTVTVVLNKKHYEVTTLRGEEGYSDGRRPDRVFFTDDIGRDLARRDFTVNAIAVSLADNEVIDPWGGQIDLAARVLRAVGDAKARFDEDGLRALRAARLAATLEFEVETSTLEAIPKTLDVYARVSAERVRDEWIKAMKAKKPSRAFEIMRTTGMLGTTCPELLEGVGCEQNKYHAYDVWGHAMACLDACTGDAILRVAALLHDVGKPRSRAFSDKTQDYTFYDHDRIGAEIADPICTRLKFSTDERARITSLVRHHLFHYNEWSDAAVRRWMRRVGVERIEDLYILNEADVRGKGRPCEEDLAALDGLKAHVARVLAEGSALSVKQLVINGNDLMGELGLKPGRILGEILNDLLEIVITDPAKNERTTLLDEARALAAKKQS